MLYVKFDSAGYLECGEIGACGSPTVGRGASVLEAVGEYVIETQLVEIRCSTDVLDMYRLAENQAIRTEGSEER